MSCVAMPTFSVVFGCVVFCCARTGMAKARAEASSVARTSISSVSHDLSGVYWSAVAAASSAAEAVSQARSLTYMGTHANWPCGRTSSYPSVLHGGMAMALFDDIFEGNLGTGLVAALGIAVLGPVLRPVVRSGAKLAIKGGLVAYD